ncbi:hypothetical protein [Cyanothece sp. BG0011]|uniref:hypothetical protein n=1 Tax=Cyanothece sp. BG0011 TaxID=2082950 RepID=UPI0013007B73|nr:hypothetical protein [Cyanothece sp. BG0011]
MVIINYNVLETHDGYAHLVWGYYWNQQFAQGQLMPKWFESAFDSLGSCSFIFYPPLFRSLSLPFSGFYSLPSQLLKGSYVLVILFNALGIFLLARTLFKKNSLASSLSIFLGIFNPYLIISLLKRGAAAEIMAMALLPWLMLVLYRALNKNSLLTYLPVSLVFSALFVSHIPSCVTILSSYLIGTLSLVIFRKMKLKIALFYLIIPLGIGLLTSAFYVMPVIADMDLVSAGGLQPYHNRLLVQGFLDFKLRLSPNPWEQTLVKAFALNGLILLATLIIGRPWQKNTTKNQILTLQMVMVAFALFMMTDLSLWVSETISVFQKIQFPWRFLAVSSSLCPYLFGYTVETATEKFPILKKKVIILAFCTALFIVVYKSANLYLLKFDLTSLNNVDNLIVNRTEISQELLAKKEYDQEVNYYFISLDRRKFYLNNDFQYIQTDVGEYLPKTVSQDNWVDPGEKGRGRKLPPIYDKKVKLMEGKGQVSVQSWTPGKREVSISNSTNIIVNLKTFYYPGWSIQVTPPLKDIEQRDFFLPSENGLMQLQLPPGNYQVKIWYQGTMAERLGIIVSLISIVSLLFLLSKGFRESNTNIFKKFT